MRLSVFEGDGAVLRIADYTLINPGARVTSAERIAIGEGCMLAVAYPDQRRGLARRAAPDFRAG